ncbi:hypothetical protein FA10DRAFT_229829 [Acaromyces ingoldii]|uniref:Uncharacterized protein n=1 Tax=Acaromyces ingoldii TaxID=215250 RepID=A0A316YPA6_9BASI|nr:hypothetical protein FA10DRAFT_229829 [Acaromyces ingoldii]PWN90634.1 hypothetical protein FA10DRAFT_229829 [Acaromyces ingoldii]
MGAQIASLRSSANRGVHVSAVNKDAASSAQKAAEGASKQLTNLADKARQLGKPLADRASSVTGVNVSSYADSLLYNLRVAGSLFKQVYIAEGMAPPKLQAIQEAYRTMYARAVDANWWTGIVNNGEWKRLALYAVEAYGIFNIGEMIGRRHIVGYKVDKSAASSASGHH